MHKEHSYQNGSSKPAIIPFNEAVEFHGHVCPGLTIGYRAAEAGIKQLSSDRDIDEELVAIVENDACGVDAVQVVTGCTLGKGNLIFKDHGKQVYTFINRETGDAVRISLRDSANVDGIDPVLGQLRGKVMSGSATEDESVEFSTRMDGVSKRIMSLPDDRLFEIKSVKAEIPEKARIFKSVKCAKCGEMVSESRARVQDGAIVCIPCYDEYSRGW